MKVFKWVAGLVAVLIASIIVGVYMYLHSTLPEYNGEIVVKGIDSEVEIIRDSFGMPHIYAATDEDAAFALGYCTAQDRLFQMELIRRSIRGRLSEVMGEKFVDVDKLFRTITAKKSLDEMFADMSPKVAAMMEAYADGINYYLANHEGQLPFEFALLGYKPEYWTAADEMASLYYMAWSLNFSFNAELTHSAIIEKVGAEMASELFVGYPSDGPTILPPEAFGPDKTRLLGIIRQAREITGATMRGCSDNWVISGDKSETGSPLLANDMHLGLIIPGVWYEAHLVTPDQNVSGVVLPGVPVIVAGANQHVAWGFTNVMADDADYYMERLNPEDSSQYEFMGQWEDMIVRHDTIEVRRGDPVPIEIRMTRHGIIIDDILQEEKRAAHPIAMKWTLTDFNREAQALYMVNRARNIDEVEQAAALHKCPGQNWAYADDQGNIGFWAAVGIPIRNGYDAGQLLPGWDGKHEWNGYVATIDQPHLKNPSRGWIATANNKHAGDSYPYAISSYYAPPDRIIRITRMLNQKEKLGIDDFKKMQADQYLVMAENWVPRMISALDNQPLSDIQSLALTKLKDWDYFARPDSAAPAIFHAALQNITETIFTERLGDSLCSYWLANSFIVHNALNSLLERGESEWFDNPATEAVENLDSVLVYGFTAAVDSLIEKFGDDPNEWKWGELHSLTLFNPVGSQIPIFSQITNVGPYPMGGGSHSLNPGLYRLTEPFTVLAGASQRHIFDLGNMKNSLRIIPAGISGNFMSDHYDDQFELWREVEYRPFFLDREDVEKEATYHMKMIPVGEGDSVNTL